MPVQAYNTPVAGGGRRKARLSKQLRWHPQFLKHGRKRIMSVSLPQNDPEEDEVALLLSRQHRKPLSVQTMSFADLPPEIRNRIYEYSLIAEREDDDLIVATPFKDGAMGLATQPSMTQLSRQTREESLGMFYTSNTFTAYINSFDFSNLVRFVQCITSGNSQRQLTIHVKFLDQLQCVCALIDLVEAWRALQFYNIHLKIHNCYPSSPLYRGFDQRSVVAKAIELAEKLEPGSDLDEKAYLECFDEGAVRILDCHVEGLQCMVHMDDGGTSFDEYMYEQDLFRSG